MNGCKLVKTPSLGLALSKYTESLSQAKNTWSLGGMSDAVQVLLQDPITHPSNLRPTFIILTFFSETDFWLTVHN